MTQIPDDPERWARFATGADPDRPAFTQAYATQGMMQPRVELRPWARASSVLIGVTVVVAAVFIYAYARDRILLERSRAGGWITDAEYDSHTHLFETLGWLWLATYLAAGVSFLVWFWRVRTNAGIMAPHLQRRSRGWALGGWICPIVNLWFPLQIARDAVYSAPERPTSRAALRLTGWWWGLWLASFLLDQWQAYVETTSMALESTYFWMSVLGQIAMIAAGIVLIRLIGLITDLQQPSPEVAVVGP